MEERAAIISGGGGHGAYSVGLLSALRRDYEFISGISTGALIAPFVALGEYEKLERGYTTISNKDIYNVIPFDEKTGKIKILQSIYRTILQGKPTIGETNNLRKLITKFYTEADHERLQASGKTVLVGCLNLSMTPYRHETYAAADCSYQDFVDWMWASCCFPAVSSIVEKNGYQYVDGGITETITIYEAMKRNYKKIDVFVLREKIKEEKLNPVTNIFELIYRNLMLMRQDVVYEELHQAIEFAKVREDVDINVYYMPYKLSDNAMNFQQKKMEQWVALGKQCAYDKTIRETY